MTTQLREQECPLSGGLDAFEVNNNLLKDISSSP